MCKYFLLLILTILSSAVCATQSQFYIGGGIHNAVGPNLITAYPSDFSPDTNGSINGDDKDTYFLNTRGEFGFNIYAGYTFNSLVGAEIFYARLGRQAMESFSGGVTPKFDWSGNLNSDYYGINGLAYLPINTSNFSLFAKLGLGIVNSTVTINDPFPVIFVNADKFKLTTSDSAYLYGIGMQYTFMQNIAARLEWNRIARFNENKVGNVSYNLFNLSFNYSFFC